jgi:hypothetical protein
LRAPREDRSVVVDPPWEEVPRTLEVNRARRAAFGYDVSGRSLMQLGDTARDELLQAAQRYTLHYRDVPAALPRERVILAGHQPELFHPGVWCKNFALASLAMKYEAAAVNLLVDSDTIKRTSVRVPGGSPYAPTVSDVRFDARGEQIPYEERAVDDWSSFESFGDRALAQVKSLVEQPLLRRFWPRVIEHVRERGRIGAGLAAARHQIEGEWGYQTLEIPQSQVCALPSFLWFTAHLLAELPRLHDVYNRAVREYRAVNHIRSLNHPVPDLADDDDWREAPYWIWTAAVPQRRRLFARRLPHSIELTNRSGWRGELPMVGDVAATVDALAGLARDGIKLRSRALVTTLFARLVLGDLFLHGIGGAKYDELTDLMIRRFFGIEPPDYMFLSATLLLPVEHASVSADDLRSVEHRLRELVYHPEVYLQTASLDEADQHRAAALVADKRHWIATVQTRENARKRCRAIRAANEQLQPLVEQQRVILRQQRARLAEALRGEAVLASREYAFCLYPEGPLRDFMGAICGRA